MTTTKKLWKALLGATALTAFTAVSAHAAGTAAGTDVQNTFTLNYEVNNVPPMRSIAYLRMRLRMTG